MLEVFSLFVQRRIIRPTFYTRIRTMSTKKYMTKQIDIRPSIDDIERISYGQAAKRRGTGSRAVPHRLNSSERREWDLAKQRRFLMLRGTGWRRERGDSPLANIYRGYCDAVGVPCVNLLRGLGRSGVGPNDQQLLDHVIIDFSPLRTTEIKDLVQKCNALLPQYTSVVDIKDLSQFSEQGWNDLLLQSEPIWRIPVFSLVVAFSVRSEARKFAEIVGIEIAEGSQVTNRPKGTDDDSSEFNEDDPSY